jgi:hypothetical protein
LTCSLRAIKANQALVKKALEILPDGAIKELGDEDIARWVVVRVNDDITVDLMTEACGVRFEDAGDGIETEIIDGVPIPFAGAELMLRMKKSPRAKRTPPIGRSSRSSSATERRE